MSMFNYYDTVSKKYRQEPVTYNAFKKTHIKVPFRMIVTGGTGSGKTNFVLNLISLINTWEKIYLFAKDLEEPLYASYIDTIKEVERNTGHSILFTGSDISTILDPSTFNPKTNSLIIIDDMVAEKDKNLNKVAEYWIRGRKRNISCIFLSQDYFKVPTIMRKNSEYFAFCKINTNRDLTMIMKDFRLGVLEEELEKLYIKATEGGFPNVFLVDVVTPEPQYKFRRNFTPISLTGDIKNDTEDKKETTGEDIVQSQKRRASDFKKGQLRVRFDDGPSSDESNDTDEDEDQPPPYKKIDQPPPPYKKIKRSFVPRINTHEKIADRVKRLCLVLKMTQQLFRKCAKEMGVSVKEYCNIIEDSQRRGEI